MEHHLVRQERVGMFRRHPDRFECRPHGFGNALGRERRRAAVRTSGWCLP